MTTPRLIAVLVLLIPLLAATHPRRAAGADTVTARQECGRAEIRRGRACVPLRDATDAEIRRHLVQRSIRAYTGSCPCPDNTDRAGRRCGRRSAYSRPGGEAPLCYPSDVSDDAVRRARAGT